MQMKTLFLFAILLSGLLSAGIHAQEVTPAAGGNATGSGGSVSYSVGQVFYNTIPGSNGTVAQGVQQPFEIYVYTGIKEAAGIELILSVYPNPASDFLILRVENYESPNLMYRLYDIQGKLLKTNRIIESKEKIHMIDLTPAVYFLKVSDGDKEIKTFKIIKN